MRTCLTLFLAFLSGCVSEPLSIPFGDADILKVCAVGDVGMGTKVQLEVAKVMSKENCDRLILLGDIIYPSGIKDVEDPVLDQKFYNIYKKFKKIVILLGNHDYQGNSEAWMEIARKNTNIIHPDSFFEEKIQDLCLVYLDTNFTGRVFSIGSEILWLKKERKHCRMKVAFSHHPYFSTGKHHGPSKGFTKQFLERLVIGKFDFLISGHEHILSDEGVFQGTRQIISGAGGKPDNGYLAGYLVLEFDLKDLKKSSYRLVPVTSQGGT